MMLPTNNEAEWARTPWADPTKIVFEIGKAFPEKKREELRSLQSEFDALSGQAGLLPTKETVERQEIELMQDSSLTVESLVSKVRELRTKLERAPELAQEIDRRQRVIRKKFCPAAADIFEELLKKIEHQLANLPTFTAMQKWGITGGEELQRVMEYPLRRLASVVSHDLPVLRSANLDFEIMWPPDEILKMAGIIGNHETPGLAAKNGNRNV